MIVSGLNTLVQPLSLAPELQAAADVVENAGETWAPEHVIKILKKRAAEWAMLPTHKKIAAAVVFRHSTQCHKWLGRGACKAYMYARSNSRVEPALMKIARKYAHDAEFKLRPDLLPPCPYMNTTGTCINTARLGCYFKHPPGTKCLNIAIVTDAIC